MVCEITGYVGVFGEGRLDLSGKKIGWILIEGPLGSGAMGTVYRGFHEKLKRPVAVKTIVKDHRLKAITRARFLREARLLSSLDHPNICQIHDYLEEEAADLLILEFIEGVNLRDWMKQPLSKADKFRAAVQLAEAIAAAHEKGIVHRDIKPENIMMTGEGVLKVLDFGLSRLEFNEPLSHSSDADSEITLDPDAHNNPLLTQQGILMGTLNYMSPEQARGEMATAASDIYALGLVMQELFTGKPPFEQGLAFAVLLRKVAQGESLPVEGQSEELTGLIQRLKSIVPQARPGAMDAVERIKFIRDAPLRMRKRLVYWSVTSALLLLATILGWQSYQIRKAVLTAKLEAAKAQAAAHTAGEVSEFLVSLFEQLDPSARAGAISAGDLLDKGVERLNTMSGPPLSKARLMLTMGQVYRKLGMADKAVPLVDEALAIRRKYLDPLDVELAETLSEEARVYVALDRYQESIDLVKEALGIREKSQGPHDSAVAGELLVLAEIYGALSIFDQALPLTQRALEIRESQLPPDAPEVGEALSWYGTMLDYTGNNVEAGKVLVRAVAILEKGSDPLKLIEALNNLGKVRSQQFDLDVALGYYARALELTTVAMGEISPKAGDLNNNIAVVYDNKGNLDEALAYFTRALEIYRAVFGNHHTNVAKALGNVALVHADKGNFRQSLAYGLEALAILREKLGENNPLLAYHYLGLARARAGLGLFDEARRDYRRALEISRQASGANVELVVANVEVLAGEFKQQRRDEDAIELFQASQGMLLSLPDIDKRDLISNYDNLEELMRRNGRTSEADALRERADDLRAKLDDDTGI